MARKQDRPRLDDTLESSVVEISVAASGFLKPYLACFRYSPENIDKEPLGALVGVLSIRDRSEDSAYIVNFLASLAKKEYYANARRNAVESFESTLHKVNIGLSELVKEGNANWVGTLDAALCVFERNSLHFAVAGDAKVILIRDGRLIDVSDGLTEGQDPHPLKTFTEVSSGKVRVNDRLLITTPEIFSVLTSGELERASNRLDNQAFDQFIRTAAVNRLDFSGTLIIHIQKAAQEEKTPKKKSALASPDYVPNAWSLSAFSGSKKPASEKNLAATREEAVSRERIDDKTGHIYVTGETPETPPNEQWEAFRLHLEDFRIWIGKTGKRMITSLSTMVGIGVRSAGRAISRSAKSAAQAFTAWQKARAMRQAAEKATQEEMQRASKTLSEQEAKQKESTEERAQSFHQLDDEAKDSIKETPLPKPSLPEERSNQSLIPNRASERSDILHTQLSNFYNKQSARVEDDTTASLNAELPNDTPPQTKFFQVLATGRALFRQGITSWKALRRRTQILSISAIILISLGIAFLIWGVSDSTLSVDEMPEDTSSTSMSNSSGNENPAETNAAAQEIRDPSALFQGSNDMRAVLLLKEEPYAVSTHEIISLGGESQKTTPLPDGKTAKYATAMPDIGTLFILTNDGSLLGYTPSNNAFSENTINLPSTENIAGIDAFLTYLYVLDTADGTIYRYPRADGGFGSKTDWMKEKGAVPFGASFAVDESIALTDGSDISLFERGAKLPTTFEYSSDMLLFTSVFLGENGTIFALDNKSGHLVEYTPDGSIAHQYRGDFFRDATDFAVDTTTHTAFVASGSSIFSAVIE